MGNSLEFGDLKQSPTPRKMTKSDRRKEEKKCQILDFGFPADPGIDLNSSRHPLLYRASWKREIKQASIDHGFISALTVHSLLTNLMPSPLYFWRICFFQVSG